MARRSIIRLGEDDILRKHCRAVERFDDRLAALLDDMAEKFAEVDDELCDVEDGLDAVSDDLSDVEETLYFALDDDEDDDEDDEEEECFVTTCPECEEEVYFDETVLEDGEVVCPNCGAKLEFDLSDLAAAAEDGEDEE